MARTAREVKSVSVAAKPKSVDPVREERQVSIAFTVSETLHYGLKMRALQERTTVRGMVMKALKNAGLDVPDADLIDRRPGRAGRKPKGGLT